MTSKRGGIASRSQRGERATSLPAACSGYTLLATPPSATQHATTSPTTPTITSVPPPFTRPSPWEGVPASPPPDTPTPPALPESPLHLASQPMLHRQRVKYQSCRLRQCYQRRHQHQSLLGRHQRTQLQRLQHRRHCHLHRRHLTHRHRHHRQGHPTKKDGICVRSAEDIITKKFITTVGFVISNSLGQPRLRHE